MRKSDNWYCGVKRVQEIFQHGISMLSQIVEAWIRVAQLTRFRWAVHRLAQEVWAEVYVRAIQVAEEFADLDDPFARLLRMAAEVLDDVQHQHSAAGGGGDLRDWLVSHETFAPDEPGDADLLADIRRFVTDWETTRPQLDPADIETRARGVEKLFSILSEVDRYILALVMERLRHAQYSPQQLSRDQELSDRNPESEQNRIADSTAIDDDSFDAFLDLVKYSSTSNAQLEASAIAEFEHLLSRIRSDRDRQILRMYIQRGLNSDTIAEGLGISTSELWRLLLRALDELRDLWG
jgi:hypothetical protein